MRTVAAEPVYGRDSVLAAFPRFLDGLSEGPGALVLEGEAGIGKTVLWSAGVALAEERGYRVHACRSAKAEMQLPFAALGDLLGDVPDPVLAALPDTQRRAFEVAMVRLDWEGPAVDRRAVFVAVLAVLRELACAEPLVLALDDVQWLDRPSAAALEFAFRRLEGERIGVLVTRRGRPEQLPPGLVESFPMDRVERVEIGPLDRQSLGRTLLNQFPDVLTAPAILQLHRVCGGNPFFALELARALKRRSLAIEPGEPLLVPQNLRELVRDRFEHVPPSAIEAGLIVAALAQPTVDRVERALLETESTDGLVRALSAGIVELEADRLRFTHPLLGSVIYSEASPGRRRELHARLATLTDEVEERARHLALAAAGADAEIAAVLDEAARRAERRGAPEAAAALLEQAAISTPETEPDRRARRSMEAAERHFDAGATARARDLFATVAEGAPSRELRLNAGVRLGAMRLLMGDLAGATVAFDRARQETTGPESVPPGIEDGLALVSEFRGDLPAAARHARAAVRLAELQQDRAALVQTLARAALFEARLGRSSAWARIRRALDLSREIEDLKVIAHPGWIYAQLLAGRGDLASACAVLRDLRGRALERGDEGSLGVVLTSLCESEIRAGRLAEASDAAEEGYLSTLGTGQISQLIFMLKGVVLVDALRGHVDRALARAAEARQLIAKTEFDPLLANMDTALGMLELSRGDPEAAHRALAPLAERVPLGAVRETGWLRFLADDVEALVALGDLDGAREALAKLRARRRTLLDQAWTAQAALRCSGLIEIAAGNTNGGLRDLAAAVRLAARGQEPFERARALLALGRTQRRLKHRREGRETLVHAKEIFSQLGLPLWQARAEDELGRLGGRPPRASGLTETEQRVAQLAGDGLTNREIAAALYLSVNTVQAYLKRVYRELGVRSRTELARRFHSDQSLKEH